MRRAGLVVVSLLAGCQTFLVFDATRDGPSADAGVDATTIGDGGAVDVTTDSGDAPFVDPCATPHTLCETFEGPSFASSFPYVNSTAGNAPIITTEQRASGTQSLLSSHASTTAEAYSSAEATFPGAYGYAKLDLDMYLEPPAWETGQANVGLVVLLFRDASLQTAGTVLFASPKKLAAMSRESVPDYFDGPLLPTNRWFHVQLEVNLTGTLAYSINGETGAKQFPAVTLGAEPRVLLEIGLHTYDPPAPSMRVFYDNVVLDLQ